MRVVVTGVDNAYGIAIVDALVAKGHQVRVFGDADVSQWGDKVQWHPGALTTLGSIEPVLAEREVLVHAGSMSSLDDKQAQTALIERGTLGCRYGAERELLDQFIHITPAAPKRFAKVHAAAIATVQGTQKVPVDIVHASEPTACAADVLAAMEAASHPGRYPGREKDALAA